MEAKELRQLSVDELKGRVKGWKEELFRNQFKTPGAEAKDTSVFKKLKKDIARGLTILREKGERAHVELNTKIAPAAAPQDAPVAKKAKAEKVEDKVEKKATKKKATKKTDKE